MSTDRITELEAIARDAADEAEGDWFCTDLLENHTPISSSIKARRFIHAFPPDTALKLLALWNAAHELEALHSMEEDIDKPGEIAIMEDNPKPQPYEKNWKLHRCPDGEQCRDAIGGGCARGWCGHFAVSPEDGYMGEPRYHRDVAALEAEYARRKPAAQAALRAAVQSLGEPT